MTTFLLILALAFIVCMALAVPMLKDHEACRDTNTTLPRAGANSSKPSVERTTANNRADRVDTFQKLPTEDAL